MSIKVAQCAARASAVVTDLRGRLGEPAVVA
jgi:hypothetical protein